MASRLKERLETELHSYEQELKITLPRELHTALAHGDLRENSEYQSALQRQEYVRARISHLQKQLSDLAMINLDKLPRDRVAYGSTVRLEDLDTGEKVTYKLTLGDDVDPDNGLISVSSPIGASLLGKVEGDEVMVRTPAKVRRFEIVTLKTIHEASNS
ncbi:MAG: GreA/GreB family elongation factor [Acidobacteria bacterium]|nr:GreA/GreB family elongation factor [Acidobacteriota bacterium]